MLSLKMRCELVQGLDLTGGLTSKTVFPRTEEKLGSSEYQKALKFVTKRKNMARYRSVMDFLFCESFPEWRIHARRFYNDQGPQLIDHPQFTDEKQKMYDLFLCDGVLEICMDSLNKKQWMNWTKMRHVLKNMRLAA